MNNYSNKRHIDNSNNIYEKNFSGLELLISDLWFENIYDYNEILQELINCQNIVLEMEEEYQNDIKLENKAFNNTNDKIISITHTPSYSTSKYKYCYA